MCSYFNHREVQPNWRLIENQEFERANKDCDVTNLACWISRISSMFKCLLENTDFKKLEYGWQKDGVIPYTESLIWQSLKESCDWKIGKMTTMITIDVQDRR